MRLTTTLTAAVLITTAASYARADELTPTLAQAEIQIGQLQVALGNAHMQILDLQKKLVDAEKKATPAKQGEKCDSALMLPVGPDGLICKNGVWVKSSNLAAPTGMNCKDGACVMPEEALPPK